MADEPTRDDVLAKLLYQQQRIIDLMQDASELGVQFTGDYDQPRWSLDAIIRESGAAALANGLLAAHDAFVQASELSDRLAQEWGDDQGACQASGAANWRRHFLTARRFWCAIRTFPFALDKVRDLAATRANGSP